LGWSVDPVSFFFLPTSGPLAIPGGRYLALRALCFHPTSALPSATLCFCCNRADPSFLVQPFSPCQELHVFFSSSRIPFSHCLIGFLRVFPFYVSVPLLPFERVEALFAITQVPPSGHFPFRNRSPLPLIRSIPKSFLS